MKLWLYFIQNSSKLIDAFHLLIFVSLVILLSFGIFRRSGQFHPPFCIYLPLILNFSFKFIISLFEALDSHVQPVHVLIDEGILILLFQKCLCNLLQLLNSALLFDFLKVLINRMHVFPILLNNLYFFLILRDNILEPEFKKGLSVYSFGFSCELILTFSALLLSSLIESGFDDFDFELMLFQPHLIGLFGLYDHLFIFLND